MSTKTTVKFGKFGQKLGFKAESKQPQRKDLISLMGQVSVYQPSQDAASLKLILDQALIKLDGQGDAKALIAEANKTAVAIRQALDNLKKEKEQAEKLEKSKQPTKKELKSMKKLQDELEGQLNDVLKSIDPTLGTIRLESEMSKTGLLATGETIRREIKAGDPNENDRDDEIKQEIDDLKLRIDKANHYHSKEGAYLERLAPSRLKYAEEQLQKFGQQVGGEYQGPLAGTVEKLRSAITGKPADTKNIRSLVAQANQIIDTAGKQKDFVKDSHKQAVEAKNGAALAKQVEKLLAPMLDSITFLREAGAPGYDTITKALADINRKAQLPIADRQVQQATKDMTAAVDKVGKEIERQRLALETTIKQSALAAQQALADAKRMFTTQYGVHKDAKALESDFKAIEALIGSAEQRVPETGELPKGATVKDVQLALSLAQQAAARLTDIKDNTATLLTFDTETKQLAKDLEARGFFAKLGGKSRETLEKYDPKTRELLEKQLEALLKALPTTPAKTSVEALKKLQDDAKKAVDDLTKPVAFIENEADTLFRQMNGLRIGWILGEDGMGSGGVTKGPKAFDEAMTALEAQMKLQPPVEATLKAAYDTANTELTNAQKLAMPDLIKQVDKETDDEKKADAENEKKRSAEKKLLDQLELKYDAAKEAVAAVDGDKNSLATIGRLIEQIKSQISANAFDTLESKRNDLEARISLLMSNPHGEANRRRSELPGVIAELRGAIQAAVQSLKDVSGEISSHDPAGDTDQEDAQDTAVELFDRYVELLGSEIDDMERAAKPIMDTKKISEDERRKAREEGLRILRSFRKRLQAQPMTSELLQAPFPPAKGAIAPVFRGLDKYEYTLTTCI